MFTLECPLIPESVRSQLNITVTTVTESSATSNWVVEYKCEIGYTLLYDGDFVRECNNDGTWSNTNVPQCVNGLFVLYVDL